LNIISKLVDKPSLILDYGCGTGEFITICKTNGWRIDGVEPSPNAREKSAKSTGIFIKESINQISGKYDVITLWHVLEHIPDLENTIEKLSTALEKDGTLLIAVPNHKSYDAEIYKETWAAYDVPRHIWHFDKKTMQKLLAKFSLNVKQILPMKLDSFYVSMLSEKYKSGNKLTMLGLIKAFVIGSASNFKARKNSNYSSLIYIIQK
jgi:2-polyprenyl-3-methyl-5-hydroxy-6-metoxy-1,4-benzoquinol methylase